MHVLVIDDNHASRFVIRSVLEHAGHTVTEAESVEQVHALALGEARIDVLIADAVLAAGRGLDAAENLRRRHPGVPVLYVSGYPPEQLDTRGYLPAGELKRSGTAFLQKPFNARDLLASIRTLVPSMRQSA